MLVALLALEVAIAMAGGDPFAFFRPAAAITADDRRHLDRGQAIARVLPGEDLEVAVLAAVPVNIDGDRLAAWIRRIAELKKSDYVLAIRRFSNPPAIDDVGELTLEEGELAEIRTCRPDRCGLKVSAAEIAALQRAAAGAGAAWKDAVQQRFRQIVLARVNAYLSSGDSGANQNDAFARLVDHSVFLGERLPGFAAYLRRGPAPPLPEVESFVYWSKERLANKPIVRITHVNILRSRQAGLPEVLVAGKEIFSTHYLNASLGLTALMRGDPGGSNYLVYVNRSEVDVLGGAFGGVTRWIVQRRLKGEAATVLEGLKRRLESGEPVNRP